MKPSLPRTLSAVPQTLHARLEIAKAIRTLTGPDENELLRQRRAEITAIRHDLEALTREIRKVGEECLALAKVELRKALEKYKSDRPTGLTAAGYVSTEANAKGETQTFHKYNADEPRVPKGHPDGGSGRASQRPMIRKSPRTRHNSKSMVKGTTGCRRRCLRNSNYEMTRGKSWKMLRPARLQIRR
jgi:hypothetical protein